MNKTLIAFAFVASCTSIALVSATAEAQPKDKAAPAAPATAAASTSGGKTEFANGRARFSAKDYVAALPLFRKAFEASSSPNASLYVGLCLIELNQPLEAYDVLTTTARESEKRMASDPAYQHTNEVAKEKLGLLDKKVARVTVTLVNAPSGATVVVNDKPLPPEKIGLPFAVGAGKVVVVASAPGQPEQRAEIVALAGEEKPATLAFKASDSGAGVLVPASIADGPLPGSNKMSKMRIAGIAVAGVGLVGFGVAIAAGLSSNAKYNKVKSDCPSGRCTSQTDLDAISSGKTLDAVANVGLVIGIAGVVGGGVLFALGGKKSDSQTALRISPRAVSLMGTF